MFVCIKLKQFYLLINWFWVCFFHSDYVKVIYITGLLIWIMHSPKSIESTMYISAVHTYNNRQLKNGIYLSLITCCKMGEYMYIALSAFHWEFFIYSFDILYGRWIRWNFRHVISLLTHFDFRIWLIWLFLHIGKTRAEGFSNRWTWNRNYHIYIDLKIRLLQKRENERLNGCFKYTKNGINSVQYIPVHIKAQKHIYLCMHAFMLDPQSRPYFLF